VYRTLCTSRISPRKLFRGPEFNNTHTTLQKCIPPPPTSVANLQLTHLIKRFRPLSTSAAMNCVFNCSLLNLGRVDPFASLEDANESKSARLLALLLLTRCKTSIICVCCVQTHSCVKSRGFGTQMLSAHCAAADLLCAYYKLDFSRRTKKLYNL
jgi:hypothetical protein